MTVNEIKKELCTSLTPAVGAGEATAMMRMLMEDATGMSPVDMALYPDRVLENFTIARLKEQAQRIIAGEPVQYVLGHAFFMGLDLKVTPAVLIPRPETAQLVDIITDRAAGASDLSVLDLCTGSGCIALALGRALVFPRIAAIDISPEALDVARENAARLHPDITFAQADALDMPLQTEAYDIIVSNPPYIADSERKDMDSRVLDHEPATALFVPDSDPLRFYKAIAHFASSALKPGGTLYFEINPLFVDSLQAHLAATGWSNVQIVRDFRGLNRFALCQR